MAHSKDSAKLDFQEQAMEQVVESIRTLRATLAEPSRAVRSWRFKYQNWRRGITILSAEQKHALAERYAAEKQAVADTNAAIDELEDLFAGPSDSLYRQKEPWLELARAGQRLEVLGIPEQARLGRQLERAVADWTEWRQDYGTYLQAQETYSAYLQARKAYEKKAAAYEDVMAEYKSELIAQRKARAKARQDFKDAFGGMPKTAIPQLTDGLAYLDDSWHAQLDADKTAETAGEVVAEHPYGGLSEESFWWLSGEQAQQADLLLQAGELSQAAVLVQRALTQAVLELVGEFEELLEPWRRANAMEAPEKPAIKRPVAPERPPKPREVRHFKTIKLQRMAEPPYPKELSEAVADKSVVDQLDGLARGPYAHTLAHADTLDVLAEQVGAPLLAVEQTSWEQAREQSGLEAAVQAARASHDAFGGQRNSSEGSRLISRFLGAVEAVEVAEDLDALKVAERRFKAMQTAMLDWWTSYWHERGGVPRADKNRKHWQKPSWD